LDLKSLIDTRRRGEPDLALMALIFVLAGIGIALNYSASAVYAQKTFGDSFYFLKRQLLWFVTGLVALFVFQEIDYKIYKKYTKAFLFISIALLGLVLVPGIGHSVKGSVRWFSIGPLSVQPSEMVKLMMVIYLVKVFSSENSRNHVIQLLIPMMVVAAVFMLILMQPDFGTAMDLLIVSVLILFMSGFPFLYIAGLFILSIPMFYLLIYQVGYRKDRILAFQNPWSDRFGKGYHVIQSFIAFKKGGLLGVGLGFGSQKISRLPEPHTDFIFAVIAEEMGLVGTICMIGLFLALFWRSVVVSISAPDDFGRLLALGLGLLIVVQAFINIGVVIGSLPATGLPLPFISYGGSSLLVNMISGGILLNISRYREAANQGVKINEEVWQ
jgi:cell division protein FtsW